jgi:O-antigen/teichoic acid export membrane protein
MKDLKEKTIRGGFAKVCAQGATFVLRLTSVMVLARLLDPKDFGLVGMVTAVIGVLNLFRDFGLSTATVQRTTVTDEQISTLFWINLLVGAGLGLLSMTMAPFLAAFYHEPRLSLVTMTLALGFLLNGAGVQHEAILQRQMRFTLMSAIDISALVISIGVGIGMALLGYGYWSLVVMTLLGPLINTLGVWFGTRWIPGRPHRQAGIRSMLRFGTTVTLNGLVTYVAYNMEKVLLGRFWGPAIVGIYGRAYQLTSIPTDNLNAAIGGVAFSALSRVQDDPARLRRYFLRGYSFVLALTVPITIVCALFANDLIVVLLGPKWYGAIPIFRRLAPTILIFALINPLGWLLLSLGLVRRSLKIAFVIAPVVICGYLIGLHYGPTGVALGYSIAMILLALPVMAWSVHGTAISFRDIAKAASQPLVSALVAAAMAWGVQAWCGHWLSPLPRLILDGLVVLGVYLGMLLYVMGEKAFYLGLVRGLRSAPAEEEVLVSA